MKNFYCRLCGKKLDTKPILYYKDMPKSAQFLPNKNNLKEDKGINLKIVECQSCGLVQLINEPVSYFKKVIRATSVSEEMKLFREKQFSNFIDRFNLKNKKIIEIGCGKGEYLEIMKKFNNNVIGVEYDRNSVTICNEKGLSVIYGYINKNTKLPAAHYKAFYILNFLEHFPEPNSVLTGILKNLDDDAVGLIEVPNFDMILKNNLFAEFIIDHLLYFTKDTLEKILSINGFEVLSIKSIWHNYILSAIVKKREKLKIADFYKQQEKVEKDIARYIAKYNKIAIWGASHQAFTILSLFKLKNKISYIIDSADFKQNKYSPASHIPIVAPSMLDINPVDAILVIAGSYSDEIVKTIQSKYIKSLSIAVFKPDGLKIIQ